jgi:hypothetical protein
MRLRRFTALWLVAAALMGQSAYGTIILILPANGGVVIAADTRAVFLKTVCDGQRKIALPKRRKNVVVLAAGTPSVIHYGDRPPIKPCEYMKSAKRWLDIVNFIARRLDKKDREPLSDSEVREIAEMSLAEVNAFDRAHKKQHPLDYYITSVGFQVDIVGYDAKHKTVLITGFGIYPDSSGKATLLRNTPFYQLSETDNVGFLLLGEKEFARKYVHPPEVQALLNKPRRQVPMASAKTAALNYVLAVEKAAQIFKTEHVDIGGPVDVATITDAGVVIKRY